MSKRNTEVIPTALGQELVGRRGDRSQVVVALEAGVSQRTLSRLESGGQPTAETAAAVAAWLGWSVERVLQAAASRLDEEVSAPAWREGRVPLQDRTAGGLPAALDELPVKVRRALEASHEALSRLGVRHVVVGGIAVSAHGHVRTTRDVDFLVGDEAFNFHGLLVTFREGLPIAVGDVAVDYLSPLEGAEMEAVLDSAPPSELRAIPVEMLVLMKLVAHRPKDRADIVGLVQAGAELEPIRRYLARVAPGQVPKFDRLVAEAS